MFQQLTLCGRLGSDVEIRFTPSGKAVANFSLATDKHKGGEKGTTWWRIAVWEAQAENCAKYLSKGATVLVVGELEEPRIWTDKQGNSRVSLEVTARTVRFIESKGGGVVGEVTIEGATEVEF